MSYVSGSSDRLAPRACRVLDTLNESVDPELQDPLDVQTAVELLEPLYHQSEPPRPSDVAVYLTDAHGWNGAQAVRVGQMWHTILVLKHVQTGRVRLLFSREIG